MSKKEALQILMKNPFFLRLSTAERTKLVEQLAERPAKAGSYSDKGFVLGYD